MNSAGKRTVVVLNPSFFSSLIPSSLHAILMRNIILLIIFPYYSFSMGDCFCGGINKFQFADSIAARIFNYSNGKQIALCGSSDTLDGKTVYLEFLLSECGSNTSIDFWDAVHYRDVELISDTLYVRNIEMMALGSKYTLINIPWLIEYFYYDNNTLKTGRRINTAIKYSNDQITETLNAFMLTEWKTQNESGSAEYNDSKMQLASRLLIASISGSSKAKEYFFLFKSYFKPDGAYAEWYSDMKAILEYSENKNNR